MTSPPPPPPRRFRRTRTLLGLVVGLVAAAGTAFIVHGRERTFTELFGDPDTGPYDFSTAPRTPYPHDALACPPGACPDGRPEITVPPLAAGPDEVYRRVKAAILALPGPDVRLDDPAGGQMRAVVRTPWIRFPDTVSASVRLLPGGGTGLWIYSRSGLGRNDFGTNRRRIAAMVATVVGTLAEVTPRP